MPVKIFGHTYYSHKSAVRAVKRKRPDIKNPDAYVATIERKLGVILLSSKKHEQKFF
jgi:hypothetical protein